MTTSETIKEISTALVGFHKEVGKIGKDAKNPFFKSSYASLSGILDAISEPLVNNGLSIVQFPEGENMLTTRLVHSSGEWMEASYYMKPVKDDPQGRGSSITYQRRYAVGAILSLNIDVDDDANAASGKGVQIAKPVQKPNGKPDISNAQFAKLLERVKGGDVKAYENAKEAFALTAQQVEAIELNIADLIDKN